MVNALPAQTGRIFYEEQKVNAILHDADNSAFQSRSDGDADVCQGVPMFLTKLAHNSKVPPKGESWKANVTDDPAIHRRWAEEGYNIGLPLEANGRVVLDFDGIDHKGGRDLARSFYQKYQSLFGEGPNVIVETASGSIHFHWKGKTKTRKILDASGNPIGDVKGNGYVLWIGSEINGQVYRLLKDGHLQPFPEEMFGNTRQESKREIIDETDPVRRLMRARAWMQYREGGEDGNGRGLRMIKTCRALFTKFGLTEDQIWPLILDFNERECKPPYDEKQLRHKMEDARKGL